MKSIPKYLPIFLFCALFFADSATALAAGNINGINRLEKGAVAIEPCGLNEKIQILNLLKKAGSKGNIVNLKLEENTGLISTPYGESVEIYRGDFSNEGSIEYALITTGGSMNVNTITVYKLVNQQLINLHLDQVIIRNLLPHGDMSQFYLQVGNPFAIVLKNKTFLRYMSYSPDKADKADNKIMHILLCTYQWNGNQFKLTGPNWETSWSVNNPNEKLVKSSNCIKGYL